MLKIFYLIFGLCIITPNAIYANYTISPVKIVFSNDVRVLSLTLKNNEDTIKHFQLSLFKVVKENFKEISVPSKDLLITPVMFNLIKGRKQLIRVAQHKNGSSLIGEYKLSIKELPRNNRKDHHIHLAAEFFIPITFEEK